MNITQLKTKITEFTNALAVPEANDSVNGILKDVLQGSLIDLQAQLITQLDELVDSFIDDDGLVEDVEDGKIVITASDLI